MPRTVASKCVLFSLATIVVASWATSAYGGALQYFERDKWFVGIGWSAGPGKITNASPVPDDNFGEVALATDDYKGGASPSVRLGHMLGQHFSVEACWNDWLVEFGEDPIKYRRTLQMWGLAATVYPFNPLGFSGGFYLSAGGGFAIAGTGQKNSVEGEAQRRGERYDDDGYSVYGELGYEFWLTSSFTAGVEAGAHYFGIDGVYVEYAWFSTFGIALNAHF